MLKLHSRPQTPARPYDTGEYTPNRRPTEHRESARLTLDADPVLIAAAVKTFEEEPKAPPLVQADLQPGVADRVTDFRDIALVVKGFVGDSYPFAGPTLCPK